MTEMTDSGMYDQLEHDAGMDAATAQLDAVYSAENLDQPPPTQEEVDQLYYDLQYGEQPPDRPSQPGTEWEARHPGNPMGHPSGFPQAGLHRVDPPDEESAEEEYQQEWEARDPSNPMGHPPGNPWAGGHRV